MSQRQGALSDMRVIDLTQLRAGPFGTQMLAEQGAEVIKVEPLEGDRARAAGPFREDDVERAIDGWFQRTNRNKRSIALDLQHPLGRAILLDLVRGADVLVENFRAGVMDRLNLSYQTLMAVNPRLVVAAFRDFGEPCGGVPSGGHERAGEVLVPSLGDIVPGMYLAFGILAAVHHAQRTGEGQWIDVARTEAHAGEGSVHPVCSGGAMPVPVMGAPVRLSATPGRMHRRAPLLGEQTDELLAGMGLSIEEVAFLRACGAVR